jgi:tetratricopeptide (TPR) repeat protein
MGDNGPFDEPSFCYAQGCQMAANSLYRQAIQQLERVAALVPNHLQARLLLANFYTRKGLPEEGLKILSHIQERPDLFPIGRAHENEMLFVESSARLANNDVAGAEAAINRTLSKYPNDQELLGTAVEVLMSNGRFTNALPLIEREMQLNPTNSSLLLTNGFANIQAGRYEEAIPPLTRLLSVDTNSASEVHNTALLNRAIAFLKSGKLEEARRDYEELQKTFPTAYRIYFGLGEIAYQRRETNVALRNYQLYLTNAAPNQDEINLVLARIKELKPGYP